MQYVFLAFSTYTELSFLQGRWDETMRQRPGRKQNELAEGLHSMRAICLRSFPELVADIKTAGQLQVGTSGKPVEIGFGIAPITASVCTSTLGLSFVHQPLMTRIVSRTPL
jgi:exocyst complex component 7